MKLIWNGFLQGLIARVIYFYSLIFLIITAWAFFFFQDIFAAIPAITNLKQYAITWAQVTEIADWSWALRSEVRLETFVTDPDNPENITQYFQLIQTWSVFNTWTSSLLWACNTSTSYNNCLSKIWEIQDTYSPWWTTYSVDISWVPDSINWYKWQTISYNWVSYSSWETDYDIGQYFKMDTKFHVSPIWWILDAAWAWNTTCYIKEWLIVWEGTVWCVWQNDKGQLWDWTYNNSVEPVQVVWITNAVQISLWYQRACVVLSDGKINCWWYSAYWAFGNWTTWTFPTPVEVTWITNAVKVTTKWEATYGHSCALLADTSVKCWGRGSHHQLWNWSTSNRYSPVSVRAEWWTGDLIWAVDVTVSYLGSCAAMNDWRVLCWGYNGYSQLWSSNIDGWPYQKYPYPVIGINNAVKISSQHYWNRCAVLSDWTWKCWWHWHNWRLWNWWASSAYTTPTLISWVNNISTLEMWYWVWCASLTDWTVKCWWQNENWQVWDWTYLERRTPVFATNMSDVKKIVWWYYYMCAIKNDDTMSCWWENNFGQLVNWEKTSYSNQISIPNVSNVSSIWKSQWEYHSCYIDSSEVYCFWRNDNGQLWDWTTTSSTDPVKVLWINNALSVETARKHSCALLADKTVKCWWYNGNWRLWDWTWTNRSTPVSVSWLTGVSIIAVWWRTNCVVLESWKSKCWWEWWYWGLWNGNNSAYYTPKEVYGISNAIDVSIDKWEWYNHTCWVLADKTVKCAWGNYYFQLWEHWPRTWWRWSVKVWDYSSTITQYLTWAKILPHNQWWNHSCVIRDDDSVWCWGYDAYWSLWTTENNLSDWRNKYSNYQQYKVQGIDSASWIALAGHSTCALLPDKTVKCWGQNNQWQLWNWTNVNSETPVQVSWLTDVKEIVWSKWHYVYCARKTDWTVWCWWDNGYGQLWDWTASDYKTTPVQVSWISNAVDISVWYYHACAILSGGTVKCWWNNSYWRLWDWTTNHSYTPVSVSWSLTNAVEISLWLYYSCARLDDFSVKCWGYDGHWQMRNGDGNNSELTPYDMWLAKDVVEISSSAYTIHVRYSDNTQGAWWYNSHWEVSYTNSVPWASKISWWYHHACQMSNDGSVYCWWRNIYGETWSWWARSMVPQTVVKSQWVPLTNVEEIASWYINNCARHTNWTITCWWYNSYWQLWRWVTWDSHAHTLVSGISNAISISAWMYHYCARLNDNSVKCWWRWLQWQIGDWNMDNINSSPKTVMSSSGSKLLWVYEISAGINHTIVRLADNSLKAWGNNSHGQIWWTTKSESVGIQTTIYFDVVNIYPIESPIATPRPEWTWTKAIDDVSGLWWYLWKISTDAAWNNIVSTWEIIWDITTLESPSDLSNWTYYLWLRSKDMAWNLANNYVLSSEVIIDTTPPTSVSVEYTDWYHTSTTQDINLLATEDSSGIDHFDIYYKEATLTGDTCIDYDTDWQYKESTNLTIYSNSVENRKCYKYKTVAYNWAWYTGSSIDSPSGETKVETIIPSLWFSSNSENWTSTSITVPLISVTNDIILSYTRSCFTESWSQPCDPNELDADNIQVSPTNDGEYYYCAKIRSIAWNWSDNTCSTWTFKLDKTAPVIAFDIESRFLNYSWVIVNPNLISSDISWIIYERSCWIEKWLWDFCESWTWYSNNISNAPSIWSYGRYKYCARQYNGVWFWSDNTCISWEFYYYPQDDDIPIWWIVNYSWWYLTSIPSSIEIIVDDWTDLISWLDENTRKLQRSDWTLSGNICTFWSFSDIAYQWSYPNLTDAWTFLQSYCYKYRWIIKDNVENEAISTNINEIKIDITAQSAQVRQITENSEYIYYNSWSETLFYKTTNLDKNFSIEINTIDYESWINKVNYPAIGTWFTWAWDDLIFPYETEYTIEANTNFSKSWNIISSFNNAWFTNTWSFSIESDNTAPATVSISCPSSYDTDWAFTINGQVWTDTWVWLDSVNSFIQRRDWILSWNNCSWWSDYSNKWPASSTSLDQVLLNWCYEYRYYSVDLVWNENIENSCVIKVDKTSPTTPSYTISENSDYIYYNWSNLYYNNTSATWSDFYINLSSEDAESGINYLAWSSAFEDSPNDGTVPYSLHYSIDQWDICPGGDISIISRNNAWLTSWITLSCELDASSPVAWSITYTDWYETDTNISVGVSRWTDNISWMSSDSSDYLLEYQKASMSNGVCWWYWGWTDSLVSEADWSVSYNFTSENWNCYKFRYTVKDKVWNISTWESTNEVMVATGTPEIDCSIVKSLNPQYQYIVSNTIYYSSNFSWSFLVYATWSELASWVDKLTFPSLWIWFLWWSDYFDSSYDELYEWTDSATIDPWSVNIEVTANNQLTNFCNINVVHDWSYPSWGSMNYFSKYIVRLTTNPSITVSNWIDLWVWIDYSQSRLMRRQWSLSWWTCINYWDYVQTTYTWSLPNIEDTWEILDSTCYQYWWKIVDYVWNESIYIDEQWDEFMVDTTKPIVTIDDIDESLNNLYLVWLRNLYYKTMSSLRQFTVKTFSSDSESLVTKVLFPNILPWFSSWSEIIHTPWVVSTYENFIYDILAFTDLSPQSNVIEFENGAWLTGNTSFDITADNVSPSWVLISCPWEYDTDWSFVINGQAWTDTWVWLNINNSFIQKKSWTLENNNCTWENSFTNTWAFWANTLWESSLDIWCYAYQYISEDYISNTFVADFCSVKVDKTSPIVPEYNISENSEFIYFDWVAVYYSNTSSLISNFDIEVITWDWDSLVKSVSGSTWFWENPILLTGSYNPWSETGLYILNYSIEQWSKCLNDELSITSLNNAWLASNNLISCLEDNDAPVWWVINYTDWYETDTGIIVTIINKWIDAISAMSIDSDDYLLEYRKASLSYDVCGLYESWTWANVVETISSPYYEFNSSWWYCYQFRYLVKDNVGNQSIWSTTGTTKVDTTKPDLWNMQIDESSPYIYYNTSSWVLYYNNSYATSNFTIQSISWDLESSISNSEWSLDFADIPSSNTYPYSLEYSIETWSVCSDGIVEISLINGAWLSNKLTIECTLDLMSPSSWSISYTNGYNSWWLIPISIITWEDLVSGMSFNDSDYLLEYKKSIYSWGFCWTFNTWQDANIDETLLSTSYNYSAENWYCYMFRYTVKDNVWNDTVLVSSSVTKVDTTLPILQISNITENSDYIYVNWNDIYYKNDENYEWSIDISVLSSDIESGIVSVSGSEAFWDSPIDYIWEYSSGSSTWEFLLTYWVELGSSCTWNKITISTINHLWVVTSEEISCILDNNNPQASIEIINSNAANNQAYLNLEFKDGQDESGVDLCRYSNEDFSWTSWQKCESSIDWSLVNSAWMRQVYYEVKDKAWNVTRVSDTTKSTINTSIGVIESIWWGSSGWWGSSFSLPSSSYKSEVEFQEDVSFKNLIEWTTTVPIRIKHPSHNYSILINNDTKILKQDWTIFDWVINNVSVFSSSKLPSIKWEAVPLRSVNIWSRDWESIYFSKPITLTLSTKWISKKIRRSDIQVYSYNEYTKKYDLENLNIKIDKSWETISVDVSHLTKFVLAYWLDLRRSAWLKWDQVPFKDIWNHWSRTYIEKLYSLGVLKSNDKFYPESLLTRVELLKIVLETFWYWSDWDLYNMKFWDTDSTQWYAWYLAKAIEIWIVDWVVKTKVDFEYLKSKYDIKNAQKILRFLWYDIKYTKKYDDQTQRILIKYQKDKWLKNPWWALWDWTMKMLNNESLVKKILDDQDWMILSDFRPQDSVNRAEAMKIIIRASWIKLIPWKNQIFPDVKEDDWFSSYVNTAALHAIVSWYWSWLFGPWDRVTRWQITKIAIKTLEYSESQ